MAQSRRAEVGLVFARKNMVNEGHRSQCVPPMFAVGTPGRDRRLGAPAELTVTFVHGAPRLALTPDIQIKKFAEVMA